MSRSYCFTAMPRRARTSSWAARAALSQGCVSRNRRRSSIAKLSWASSRSTLDTQVHSVFIPHLRRTKRQVQRREQRAAAQRLGHRIDLFKALHRHCGNGQMAAAALPCVLQVVFIHGLQSLLSVDRGAGRKHPAACSMV